MSDNTARVTDEMWRTIEWVLVLADPPARVGRKRVSQRRVAEALAYKLRTGCRWNDITRLLLDDSSVHGTMKRWQARGAYPAIVAVLADGGAIGALP